MDIYNIALLPEKKWSDLISEYSRTVHSKHPAIYVHGESSLPHITLLQFQTTEPINAIWESIESLKRALEVRLGGLSFSRFLDLDCLWLKVHKSKNLGELQNQAIACLRKFQLKFINQVGDDFEPHCTIAAWNRRHYSPEVPLQDQFMSPFYVNCTLSLGLSGANFQYAKSLFGPSPAKIL